MAAPNETATDDPPGASEGDSSGFETTTFDTSPDPDPSPADEADEEPERAKGVWTVVAVVAAIGLAAASVILPRDLVGGVGMVDMLIVGGFGFAVALAGMLPMRWGWYIVPGVAAAHYGLNFYNILFSESSVYAWVPGDAYGYALFTPLVGVVLGYALQGLYTAIVRE